MDEFTDYYELLQLSPKAEWQTIQRVYRMLAGRYHPDNPETADTAKFLLLQEAFETLSDADARAAYDVRWEMHRREPLPVFDQKEFMVGKDAEANRRLGALCLLYNQRRNYPDQPGLSLLELEQRMNLPREHLEFTMWYLRDKELVRRDENSSELQITAGGVDFVESNLPVNRIAYKLLQGGVADSVPATAENGCGAPFATQVRSQ